MEYDLQQHPRSYIVALIDHEIIEYPQYQKPKKKDNKINEPVKPGIASIIVITNVLNLGTLGMVRSARNIRSARIDPTEAAFGPIINGMILPPTTITKSSTFQPSKK